MKRVLSIVLFICLVIRLLPVGSLSVFAVENSASTGTTIYKAIAAGDGFTVALKEDGTAIAWGANDSNQCMVPSGLSGVKAIAARKDHTVALKDDGTVVAWGGDNLYDNKYIPSTLSNVPSGLSNVKAIATGSSHIVALKEDGTVSAWGYPSTVPTELTNVKAIAAGNEFTVALKEDGTLVIWGDDRYGPCSILSGLSNIKSIAAGENIVAVLKDDGTLVTYRYYCGNLNEFATGLSGIKTIAFGDIFIIALKEDGNLTTLGNGSYGQCNIPSGLSGIKSIAASSSHSVALKEDGTLAAWGQNGSGQCIIPGISGIKTIACGLTHTVALKYDGTVVAWGDNSYGQCNVPSGLYDVKAIAAGDRYTVALKEDGTVAAWGDNWFGQCNVPSGLSGVKAITVGVCHTVALKEDGTVAAWGNNSNNQLMIPVGLSKVKAIAAGGTHTIALKEDGTVVVWGNNADGQCNVPSGLSGIKAIAAGNFSSIALKEDGTFVSWKLLYTPIPEGLSNIKAIAAGIYNIIALKEDGSALSWGYYSYHNIFSTSLTKIKAISANRNRVAALKEDGTVIGCSNIEYGTIDHILPFPKGNPTNSITPSTEEFSLSNPSDITIKLSEKTNLLSVKNGIAPLTSSDYSISGNIVTIKKSYLTYFFNKFNISGQKLYLTFDFEDGNDPVLTVSQASILNCVSCDNPVFDLSDPQDLNVKITDSKLLAIKCGPSAVLSSSDYSISGNVVTIKKSYLTYFFNKFNAPDQKLNLTFDFEKGNDCLFAIATKSNANSLTCANPAFNLLNPKDIIVNIAGNSLSSIKCGSSPLTSSDYSISGNIITIKKSYLTYFFNRFSELGQSLYLTFDFDKGNDPILTLSQVGNPNISFVALVKDFNKDNKSLTLIKDTNGTSTEIILSAKTDSDDLKSASATSYGTAFNNLTSASAVSVPITWDNFAANDMQNNSGCKNSVTDPQHRIYKFYIDANYKITKIVRMNFGADVAPTKFNMDSDRIEAIGYSMYIDGTILFDLKDSKVVYWKDIEGRSTGNVRLKASMKENGVDAAVVAFVNDTYKYIFDSNLITCATPVFDSSNPQDITINISAGKLASIKNGSAPLTSSDYSISGNAITIKKSYLSYFFTKFNAPWAKLNLTFDFEDGNDPIFTVSPVEISNFANCDNPVFDPLNPKDITVNITGNALSSIKNGSAALASSDYSISGNVVTIKKSYLSYFFTKFNASWVKLNLVFDFEKGNDPLFTVSKKSN